MSVFFTILVLMLVVSLSQVFTRILPLQIPLPLIQIGIGVLLAWPDILHVNMDPELFMVLFIPPLLFYDGRKTALPEFMQQIREIIGLAFVLVFITIISIGYLTYLIIPEVSLPAAFALAAVLSPTDAVALTGIVGEGKIAKNKMNLIEGEALMNDASGLISFKFAVLIALGAVTFNIVDISFAFFKEAIGGLLVGFIITLLYSALLRLMLRWNYDDTPTQIIFILLLPFAAYLTADAMDLSGILAAVSAGMAVTHNKMSRKASISTRLQSENIWSMLTYIFNGMVFLILGLQIPSLVKQSISSAIVDPLLTSWELFAFVILVYSALILTRYCWLWAMRRLSTIRLIKKPLVFASYSNRDLWISSFAGVRGAITLAGVLSLPIFLDSPANLMPLTGRYVLIFVATGVILLSLLVAAIVLPLLLGNVSIDRSEEIKQEQLARQIMADQAIISLNKMTSYLKKDTAGTISAELFDEVNNQVINSFKRYSTEQKNNEVLNQQADKLEHRLRLIALSAERATLYQLRAKNQVSREVMEKILYDLDLLETVLTTHR